jgi:hypothetical protein
MREPGLTRALGLLQSRLAHFGLVARLALLALGNVHHTADRKHGNDEKHRDEAHAFLQRERTWVATLAAVHGLRSELRAPEKQPDPNDDHNALRLAAALRDSQWRSRFIRGQSAHFATALLARGCGVER